MLLRLYSLVRNSRYQAFHKYWQNGLIFKWLNSFLYIRQRYLKKNTGWKCVSLQAWSVIYKVSVNCCAKISITSWHEIYVGGEEFHNINFPSVLLEWKLKKAAADHKRYFRDFWLHLVFLQVEKKKKQQWRAGHCLPYKPSTSASSGRSHFTDCPVST